MQTQSLGNAPKELNLQRWSLTGVSLPGSSVLGGPAPSSHRSRALVRKFHFRPILMELFP